MSRYYDPQIGRFINADSLEYLDPETIGGLNLYAYCGNNPVMGVDPMGTLAVATLIGIGALVGFLVSGITSLATELIDNKGDWSKINVGLVISDAIFGAIDGALSATGMGLGASIAVNMLLSGVQSVVTDLILGETDSMLENALLAMGTSIAYSFLPGGYDSKKLSGIYKTSDSYLGRLVSESKKLMYKNKKKLVLKTVAKQNLKYAGSTIVSSGIDWGLSKLEGIFA